MKLKTLKSSGTFVELEPDGPDPDALPQIKLKKILVPVDFSESSRKALLYAASFARQFHAELLLVNVVNYLPVPPVASLTGDVMFSTVDSTRGLETTAAKELAKWRKAFAPGLTVRTTVKNGTPDREIVHLAEENQVDLIVIGKHGHAGLARLVMGGTARKIVEYAACPVFVVHEREHDFVSGMAEAEISQPALK